MMMSSHSKPAGTWLRNLRVVGLAIVVLAALVYLNIQQIDGEREAALHSSGVLNTDVEMVLVQQRTAALSSSLYEYGALVAAGLGVTLALAGYKLHRASRKTDLTGDHPSS
jgi:hypothetical protein